MAAPSVPSQLGICEGAELPGNTGRACEILTYSLILQLHAESFSPLALTGKSWPSQTEIRTSYHET